MIMILYTCVILAFTLLPGDIRSESTPCSCQAKDQCKRINKWTTTEKQVVVVTDLTSNYQDWLWDSLTTVLVLNKSIENQAEIMCYAHSKGKQYGFFLDIPATFNSSELNTFIGHTVQDVTRLHADVVALNFLELIGDCGHSQEHATHIADSAEIVLHGLRSGFSDLTLLCVLPWKPPCYDTDCLVTPLMAKLCDGLILNLESFTSYCQESCTAKPLVPYPKLILGIEEYLSMGFDVSQFLVTVPWHGFRYSCESSTLRTGLENSHICHLSTEMVNNKSVCQYQQARSKVNIGQLIKDHPDLAHAEKTYSYADQAASFFQQHADNTSTMTWFEDIYSLEQKYQVVNMFDLKGVIIYTADDLTYTHVHTNGKHEFDEFMWSWMVHELFKSKLNFVTSSGDSDFNYSGMSAGIGILMLVFGTGLGVIITCHCIKPHSKLHKSHSGDSGMSAGIGILMFVFGTGLGVIVTCYCIKRRSKLHKPFSADMHTDEYHDDL